jgi:hypothetical protein
LFPTLPIHVVQEGIATDPFTLEKIMIATQTVKVGKYRKVENNRICLWNRNHLPASGFPIGTPIDIVVGCQHWGGAGEGTEKVLTITIGNSDSRRKVSKVSNHGNTLPVIDLKGDIVHGMGTHVVVEYHENRILIRPVD